MLVILKDNLTQTNVLEYQQSKQTNYQQLYLSE